MPGLVTEGCNIVSDCILICILSVLVEILEMSCAEAADALALQKGKFILNPVLALCHFLWSLARLELHKFAIVSPLVFEPSLAHFDRQLVAAGKPLPQAFLSGLVLCYGHGQAW